MNKLKLMFIASLLVCGMQVKAQAVRRWNCPANTVIQVANNVLSIYTITPSTENLVPVIDPSVNRTLSTNIPSPSINSLAYSTIDDMLWAVLSNGGNLTTGAYAELMRIDRGGRVSYDTVKNATSTFNSTDFYVGTIYNGFLYIAQGDKANSMYVVNINPNDTNYLYLVNPANTTRRYRGATTYALSSGTTIADWVYDIKTNSLIAISNTQQLLSFDPTTGNLKWSKPLSGPVLTAVGPASDGSRPETVFGSMFYDANGNLYAFGNHTGNLYEVDTNGNTAIIANLGVNNNNDGANCPNSIIAPSALPVTQLILAAQMQGSSVQLTWGTTTEINSKHFTVQRSADGGKTWINIGTLPTQAPNGNSSSPLTYQLTDLYVPMGNYEYRVIETDIDGNTMLSNVARISITTGGTHIFPNPAKSVLKVALPAGANSVPYRIISTDGKVVLQGSMSNQENFGQISVAGLASAVYFLQVTINNAVQTYKVQVQH